ncbi:MAG: ERCC4 domain-containing protein [Nitrospirae bacterium]|nr:ERCC4 domain-containing protein [Nitrospirota bacterium]
MITLWILESVNNPKFPYRLTIRQGEKLLLALRVQDKWPGQKGNIFCIREENWELEPPVHEIERVPVISIKRLGKRLALVLDRAKNKRCDFLFLTKRYKTRDGEYEQIFWRTQQALRERKPRVKLTTYHAGRLNIIIDKNEKYAWKFSECAVEKAKLPAGDYGLKDHNGILALVERKTFDNLLAEFGKMPLFHQQLAELSAYRHSALVIEADYSDFLKPDRLKFYRPSFAVKAIAELYALHPALTIVFAGSRKLANEWTYRFFSAVNAHEGDVPHQKVAEVIEEYGAAPETRGGIYFEIKRRIVDEFPVEFTISEIREKFPDVPVATVRKALNDLKKEGAIANYGIGKKSYWKKGGA